MSKLQPLRPTPRGPLSEELLARLVRRPGRFPPPAAVDENPLESDDLQLALYCCYELHYQGLAGVDDRWEWEPSLVAWRQPLEAALEDSLRAEVPAPGRLAPGGDDVEETLRAAIDGHEGPSLSRYMLDEGTLEQMRELAVHRSAYQRKEADPHTWGIPRLTGGPKAALIEIQLDEYGGGVESEMHSSLFATTMEQLGLDSTYGAYIDLIPGWTLATTNLVSLFGLHRRWRGALVGHLAVFEMTSVGPMSRYAAALQRLDVGAAAQRFYDVHVAIDAHHEIVASKSMAAALASLEPDLAPDIVFGAQALMLVEERFTRHVLEAWSHGRSSLRSPLPEFEGRSRPASER